MMNPAEIKDKVRFFFQNNILYNESMEQIEEDESLIESGYIDSIVLIKLVTYIERTFNFRVFDNEIIPDNFDSLNRIYSYINVKIAA